MDVYQNTTKKLNQYTKCASSPKVERGDFCLVNEVQPGVFCITSMAREAQEPPGSTTFVEVLREWGCSWLWGYISIEGGTDWIAQAIMAGSLVAIMDGSYKRQLYPNLCSAAFVLECSHGSGRLNGLFKEASKATNTYRGELLGLMAINLILFSVSGYTTHSAGM
jgi:hypothetical protein